MKSAHVSNTQFLKNLLICKRYTIWNNIVCNVMVYMQGNTNKETLLKHTGESEKV